MNYKLLYFQGNYPEISHSKAESQEDLVYQIGALYMLGAEEEAKILTENVSWSDHNYLVILFFETLNQVRHSNYNLAKTNIRKAYFIYKKSKSNSFYFYQLLAFYYYISGTYTQSLKYALQALKFCDLENSDLEKIYSMEIIGHIYFQTGEFFKSIEFLKRTQNYALKMKCKGTANAIRTNIIGYCLEGGYELKENIKKAESIIQSAKPHEFYLLAQTQLQLSSGYFLSGNIDRMEQMLHEASFNIYKTKNNRQSILLNIHLSNLNYLRQDYQRSLFLIENAKQFIEPEVDFVLQLRLISLEIKVLNKLNHPTDELRQRRSEIAKRTPYYLEKIRQYYEGESNSPSLISDPIFLKMRELDRSRIPSNKTITSINKDSLLGLLHFFSFTHNQNTIFMFGIKKNRILIIKDNNIFWTSSKLTSFQFNFIKLLSQYKELTKKEIVEKVWNYEYIDYHHDQLIYNLITRIKKSDPRIGKMIHVLNSISFDQEITIHGLKTITTISPPKIKDLKNNFIEDRTLNYRQIQLLEDLDRGEFISPKNYMEVFEVSRITATRDLKHLKEIGFFKSIGQARSIRYIKL